MIDLRRKWARHRTFEMNLICSLHLGTFLVKFGISSSYTHRDLSVHTDIQADEHDSFVSADDPSSCRYIFYM